MITGVDDWRRHTVIQRHIYGAEFRFPPGAGATVGLTNSGKDVDTTDSYIAKAVASHLSDPDSIPLPYGVEIVKINASGATVKAVAEIAFGSTNYQARPERTIGPGTNSTTTPLWIAQTAARLAGNEFKLPSASCAGSGADTVKQVEYDVQELINLKTVFARPYQEF